MKLSISFKLMIGLSLLIFGMTASIGYFNSEFLKKTILQRERDFNLSITESKAKEIATFFDKQTVTITYLTNQLLDPNSADEFNKAFLSNPDLLSLEIISATNQKSVKEFKKPDWNYITTPSSQTLRFNLKSDLIKQLKLNSNRVITMNSSALYPSPPEAKRIPVITMVIPYSQINKELNQVIVAQVSTLPLQKIFANNRLGNISVFNDWGYSVVSSNEDFLFKTRDISRAEIFQFVKNYPLQNYSGIFDHDMKSTMVSFAKTQRGVFVLSEVPAEVLLAPAQLIVLMTLRLSGYFFAGSLFLLFLFSLNLTRPLEKLADISLEIAKGNFEHKPNHNIKKFLKDEVYILSVAIDKMVKGLKERDRFKNLFNKFHGSAVTEDLMKSEITLSGESKNVFVFFSDLRGFTNLSESKEPAEVVKMLNEYFSYMVPVINKQGGVVDKFIGDAIMAVWGVPHQKPNDGKNALMACIKMREALVLLNKIRADRQEPELWIGMALHYGEAISGTIGSEERMEYTVIGNTINTASRIEASTKAFGTDLLVSEEVRSQLDGFVYDDAGFVEVKGRSEALKLYKVSGYINELGKVIAVKTPYSDYQAEETDKVKIVA